MLLTKSSPVVDGHAQKHDGFRGIAWKAARVGERLSPYVGAACVIMAFHILFIKG